MKLKPLYCDACGKESRGFSRPVVGYIICNYCNIHILQTYYKLELLDGNAITLKTINHESK